MNSRTRLLLSVFGTVLFAAWAVQQFAAGHLANGIWISAFEAVIWLPWALARVRRMTRLRAPGFLSKSPYGSYALRTAPLALFALLLSICEFFGLLIRKDEVRGAGAFVAFLLFAHVTIGLARYRTSSPSGGSMGGAETVAQIRAWFQQRGFSLAFKFEKPDVIWADLTTEAGQVVAMYAKGGDEIEAARRAKQRYEEEQ